RGCLDQLPKSPEGGAALVVLGPYGRRPNQELSEKFAPEEGKRDADAKPRSALFSGCDSVIDNPSGFAGDLYAALYPMASHAGTVIVEIRAGHSYRLYLN